MTRKRTKATPPAPPPTGGFAKLYGSRLMNSSLLETATATRWAFVIMLSGADEDGFFRCATPNALARAANITLDEAEKAIAELEAPDPKSTTPKNKGRRIVPMRGGWRIVNYETYREYRTARQVEWARQQREWRERHRGNSSVPDSVDMSIDVNGQSADVNGQSVDKIPEVESRKQRVEVDLRPIEDLAIEGGPGGDGRQPSTPPASPKRSSTFWWDEDNRRIWGTEKARTRIRLKWTERGITEREFADQLEKLDRYLDDRPTKRQPNANFANRINNWMNNFLTDMQARG